jgi:hypothetical protein
MLDARRGEDGPVFCKRRCRFEGLPPCSDATVAIPYPSTRRPNSPAAPAYVDWQAPHAGDMLDTETAAILTGFKDLCTADVAKRDRLEMCRIWIDASGPLWHPPSAMPPGCHRSREAILVPCLLTLVNTSLTRVNTPRLDTAPLPIPLHYHGRDATVWF